MLHLGRWREDKVGGQDVENSHDSYLVLEKSPRDSQKYESIGSCNITNKEPLAKHMVGFTIL